MYRSFNPADLPAKERHEYLLGTVAPRPIAWASTLDEDGRINLAPFSFFNVFGSNPPILIFSPARRVRDNTTKHTLENAHATGEVVVNIASYELAGQMILTSGEFEGGVNEFELANLEMIPSELVRPPRVKGAPASFECKVKEIVPLGDQGGAGNLVICEVIKMHLREDIFDKDDKIDPVKVDNIARMGRIWYTRASEGLFQIPNPQGNTGLGFDRLPDHIRNSRYLTGSDLARLAAIPYLPSKEEIEMVRSSTGMKEIYEKYGDSPVELESKLHTLSKTLISENKLEEAWRVLLSGE